MTTLTLVPRSAAADRSSFERAFAALEEASCAPRARGESGLDACCPSHDDTDASLSGDWKPGNGTRSGAMFLKCHAASGCTFDTILDALGLSRADMFDGLSPEFAERRGTDTPSPRRPAKPVKPAPARPRRATGEKKPKADHDHDFAHERTHTYADAQDTIVARIHRKRCKVEGCREKTFRTAYPNGKPDDGVPLYGTPELTAAIEAGRTIHICEGEGDQEALTAAGEIAVSAPFGADSGTGDKWLTMHTEQLRGARSIVVWADRDPAGLMHAGYIANQLLAAGVVHAEPTPDGYGVTIDLRIVYPAVTTAKADASDHFAAGHFVDDVVAVPSADLASTGLEGLATTDPAATQQQHDTVDQDDTDDIDDIDDALEDRDDNGEPGGAPPGYAVEGSSGWRYDTNVGRRGAMWRASGRGENRTFERELSWAPVIEERLVVMNDDGTAGAKHFTIRVGEDVHTVAVMDLRTGEAWDSFPDAVGTGSKPVKEALLNCVETQAQKLPRTPVVTRMGWHVLPGSGLTYVYADGRTFPEARFVRLIGVPDQLRRAAEPLDRTADDRECRQALADVALHGWAGFMGLAVGARSLAYTLRPVPASFLFDAEPNSGKTAAANTGRSLIFTARPKAWPPVVTKGFNSTVTDIECAVDLEGDTPLLLDDVALTRASSAVEVRDMEKKLEFVLRAAGNMTDIRGRRNRDLTAKPGNRVRAVPVIAAQMLPVSMQESLYRRSVVVYMTREGGELDWRWYRDGGGDSLALPLRTIGDRIIRFLHGLQDADAYLTDLEAKALKQFAPYAEAELPEASGTMDGVVTAAAQMLAGFGLLAAVTGLEMEPLIDVVAAPLATCLAKQAAKMDDQHVAQDDLSTAVVEVVRQALSTGRAHVRDDKGTITPAVPGEVEQVQGVTANKDGSGTWEGKGPAFYWLPEKGPAFAVRTPELHTLLKASSDPRVQGLGQRTLPDALLQAGLTIRNDRQKDRVAVHQIRVGDANPRLLLMKADLVWDLDTPPETEGGDGGPGNGGTPPADGDGTSPSGNSLANHAENNGYNGYNGDSAGQSPAAALFGVIAAKNGDTAGQSGFSIPGQTAAPNGDNALTSNVTVVAVPAPANGDSNGYTTPAAQNGDNALTSNVTVPDGAAPAPLSTGDNALTSNVTVPDGAAPAPLSTGDNALNSTVTVPPAHGPEENMALPTEPVTLSFGLPSLDATASRLTGGTTTVIAGAPGAGASLLALAMARTTVLAHQRPVLYAASGPTRDDVIGRMVAAQAGLDYQQLRAGTLPPAQQTAAQQTATALGWPLLVDDTQGLTAQDIDDLAADFDGLALVVVDRLQHEHADHLPLSGAALPDAAHALKQMAARLNVPVLLVADTDDAAVLATLDADLTLTVARDGQDAAVTIKQRDGGTARVQLHADLACARLTERPEPAPTPSPRQAPEPTKAAKPTHTKTTQEAPAADATYPNGPLAVLDITDDNQVIAHLVDGRTTDCPARSIPTLVKWTLNAGLGAKRLHKWGTDGDPMVILTAAATKKFGLPDTLEDVRHQRLPDNHKVVKAIAKSGFELTKRGFSPWTRIYKPIDKEKGGDRACVQIGIVPWDALGAKSGWYLYEDTPAADIARILGIYTQRVISPRGTMGSSGLELMLQLRPPTKPVWSEDEQKYVPGKIEEHLHRTVGAVPCEANGNHPIVFKTWPNGERPDEEFMREEAWSWHRDALPEECALAYCIGIDINTSFLSASSRLLVGGNADPVHYVAPPFDPKIPGAWKVDFSRAHLEIQVRDGQPNPLDPRLPSPFTNTGEPPVGPRWYTTQTCDYARKMGVKVEPIEAWLREPLGSGWLDPWNERLATAYKTSMANLGLGITEDMPMDAFLAAMERLAAGEGDPIERTVLKAIKQTVKSGVGKLAQTPSYIPGYRPGTEWSEMTKFWWRPDIRAAVISTARVIQHRKIVKTLALTGRAPLATYSDCVLYPTHTTNPLEAIRPDAAPTVIKGAFNFGVRPGYAKVEGIRTLDWFQQVQADGINAAKKVAPRDGERVDEGE